MSAFICSPKLIANVAQFIHTIANDGLIIKEFAEMSISLGKELEKKDGTFFSVKEIYEKLYAMNVDSVNHRYGENISKIAETMPSPVYVYINNLSDEDEKVKFVQMLKNVHCLAYQSCERSTSQKYYKILMIVEDGIDKAFPDITDSKLYSLCGWSDTI